MFDVESQVQKEGFKFIIGLDEAGRGPLAGPVVASAVFLKKKRFANRIDDSKKLTPREREEAFHEILEKAYVGVGVINEGVIDEQNILQATFHAMTQAVAQLARKVSDLEINPHNFPQLVCLLIDGPYFKSDLPYTYKTIVRGDETVLSIACASIVAKVVRDRILMTYDRIFPQYGFKEHKGYPTPGHKAAIQRYGLSMIHRKTFHYE